jgi:putative addiction module component (TIGR02574 family)
VGNQARQLLEAALALPKTERAELAEKLRASVESDEGGIGSEIEGEYDPSPEVEKAWTQEITRRAERVMRGESKGTPWEEVKARMVERFGPK